MRVCLLLLLTLYSVDSAFSQEGGAYPVLGFQAYDERTSDKLGLDSKDLDRIKLLSRSHLKGMLGDPKLADQMEVKDVQVLLPRTTLFPPSREAREARTSLLRLDSSSLNAGNFCAGKGSPGTLLALSSNVNRVIGRMEDEQAKKEKFNPGMIYITWGYNRAWHTDSDAMFRTSKGHFTIKDAHATDRPSTDLEDYIRPSHFFIPQYNFRIGYHLTPKWSVEGGMDHMKWVFDNTRRYEVEGEYDTMVFVQDPSNKDNLIGMDFEQVKESGNLEWISFEHSDGYNYAFVSGVYHQNLLASSTGKFKLDALGGIGAGLVIPKTKVIFHQGGWWNFEGLDNKFHLAGYGGHADGTLKASFGKFFASGTGRFTLIKIDDALVNDQGDKFSQTPIGSFEVIGSVGYQFGQKKKKKIPQD